MKYYHNDEDLSGYDVEQAIKEHNTLSEVLIDSSGMKNSEIAKFLNYFDSFQKSLPYPEAV